jgi:Fungal Zn(2)-Cys(6) binuclear cluster domain
MPPLGQGSDTDDNVGTGGANGGGGDFGRNKNNASNNLTNINTTTVNIKSEEKKQHSTLTIHMENVSADTPETTPVSEGRRKLSLTDIGTCTGTGSVTGLVTTTNIGSSGNTMLCASCDRCRARKTKCDGKRPCSNCIAKYMKKYKTNRYVSNITKIQNEN